MIKGDIVANGLLEYYSKLCLLQAGAHHDDYLLVHDEIRKHLKDCNSYTEFGIAQGATLAAAILEHPKMVSAYDIKLDWYNRANNIFEEYATNNNIDFQVYQQNTLSCSIDETDLLYIDSAHVYSHLTKELTRHGYMVKKYIVFHDTNAQEELRRAVNEYVTKNPEWTIITDCKINVGFMTIKRN